MKVNKVHFVENDNIIIEYSTIEEVLSVFKDKSSIYITDLYVIDDKEYEIEEISFSIENRLDFEIYVYIKQIPAY